MNTRGNRFGLRTIHSLPSFLLILFAVVVVLSLGLGSFFTNEGERQKSKRRDGGVLEEVVNASAPQPVRTPSISSSGFSPQVRLGYTSGDQWEPAIASDGSGHIYVLYAQYFGVPGCSTCPNPTLILQVSNDGGSTWEAPRQISSPGTGQWDPQIVVDPVDRQTVYAAWLQDGKSDIAVAKSTDFGQSWTVVVADATNAGTDKPILNVRGKDVYVAYNHSQKIWVSSSHDSGKTFQSVVVNKGGKLGWALAGGGTVAPNGSVYFSWAGYERNGGAKGDVNLFVSKSGDGGSSWITKVLDVSGSPPDCSSYLCGWAYLGAQMAMASDAGGTLYALWNASQVDKGQARIYFSKSTDSGSTWISKVDVSLAQQGTDHSFPAVGAAANGDVRIVWMDARAGGLWNTYNRNSTNGGGLWSAEVDISTYVEGFDYIQPNGFSYPFGDYFELDIDGSGVSHVIMGQGLNYDSPGSIWYTRGR
jgi:hypothetical protein